LEGVGLELYVEKLGWMMQASNGVWAMVVYDRDQSGTAVDRHAGNSGSTTAAFSQLTLDVVHLYGSAHAACKGGIMSGIACSGVTTNPIAATAGGASCAVPPTTNQECANVAMPGNPVLDASREDGYFDGTLSLQGARAYDPNLNQWTTPDAYSGDAHDPMSQHPYMWNNNNPVQYSDPSGYVSTVSGDKEGDVTDVRIDVYIQFGGDADTKENENAYIGGLMSTWNNKNVTDMNGKTYHTSLNIHVVSGGTGAPAGQLNRVNITNNLAADTRPFGMMDRLNVRSNELSGFGPSHEFGHLMGMTDFYCAVKAGCMNGLSYGTPFSWATNDIMGVFNGQVTGNDIANPLATHGQGTFSPGP
jgi:RHS repeat-associated protein